MALHDALYWRFMMSPGSTDADPEARTAELTTMRTLLKQGLNVNERSEAAYDTPLHVAAEHNDEDAVSLLLEFGANVSLKNDLGDTALHIASEMASAAIVKRLLDHGASLTVLDANGQTPLDRASDETRPILAAAKQTSSK